MVHHIPVNATGVVHGVALCWTALMADGNADADAMPVLMSTIPLDSSQEREHWQQWFIGLQSPVCKAIIVF